ncbi:MAG: hypothetical protein KGH53_03640 [Candidatus Micrarchaeota archaeon]|nr:hypothetical protein [Candidatus Micrarchaeota archaeon]
MQIRKERKDGERRENVSLKIAGAISAIFGASSLAPGGAENSLPVEAAGVFFLAAGVTLYSSQLLFGKLLRK